MTAKLSALGALTFMSAVSFGCSSSDSSSSVYSASASPLENWNAIARAKGCKEETAIEFTERCTAEVQTLLSCTADHLGDCHCESDDNDLNCEGTYKADEGSASCKAEVDAIQACEVKK